MSITLAEKLKRLDKLSEGFNKKFNKTLIGRISENPELMDRLDVKFIETPSMNLNNALGGGFAKGKTTIVAGAPDSGKTGLLLETIGKAMQKDPNFVAGWLESEGSLTLKHLETFKIDPARFYYCEHDRDGAGEAALDKIELTLAAGSLSIMVINSLKCLVPSEEFRKTMGEVQVGAQARMNSKMMRKFTSLVTENNVAFVIVQQLTTQIGTMSRDPLIISGGNAILYGASVIMDLRKRTILDTDPIEKEKALKVGVTIKKNHVVIDRYPYVKTEYYAIYNEGIEQYLEVLQNALEQGILAKAGAFIKMPDENGDPIILENGEKLQWQGNARFREYCIANQEFFEKIKNQCNGHFENVSEEEFKEIEKEQSEIEESLNEDIVEKSKKKKK